MVYMAQERSSKAVPWFWIIAGLLIVVAAGGFALKAVEGSFQYYLTTDEYVKKRESYEDRYVKIAGIVSADSLRTENQSYEFEIEFGGESLPVIYRGLPPDTFKEGVEVVVEGRGSLNEAFEAQKLMAKCASKYEVGQMPNLENQKQGY